MKYNPHPFQIQEYYAEGQRGRYVVINPEGFDFVGEHMPYKEAVSIVRHEKLLLRATNNMRLLKLVAKLIGVADYANSIDDRSECQEWLENALFLANDKEIREIIRKPSKLHELLATEAQQSAEQWAINEKHDFIRKNIDVDYLRICVTRLLDEEFVSVENINTIVTLILEYADMDNLRIMSEDKTFILECAHLNVVEWEAEQKHPSLKN